MQAAIPLFVAALTSFLIWAILEFAGPWWLAGILIPYVAYESFWRWRLGYWRPDRW